MSEQDNVLTSFSVLKNSYIHQKLFRDTNKVFVAIDLKISKFLLQRKANDIKTFCNIIRELLPTI